MSADDPTELEKIPGIGPKRAKSLRVAGFETLDDIDEATEADLRQVPMIDDILARDIKATVGPGETSPSVLKPTHQITPRDWTVTDRQVAHLQELTDDIPHELAGVTALEIRDSLEWVLDPELLGFRQVCGKVVVHDEDTGEQHPVPHATVHVEDADCSFLSYFPEGLGYGWFFPFECTREEIATVTTDECGEFCLFVPQWDIDRVLEYRRERVCLPDIYKPRLRDVLENPAVYPEPVLPPRGQPRPDPRPRDLQDPGVFERLSDIVGESVLQRLDSATEAMDFGNPHDTADELLARPAFPKPVEPPLPDPLGRIEPEIPPEEFGEELPVGPEIIDSIDFDRYVGPFLRCRDVFVPEWRTFIDVPDITFRVTQDVDRDGTEETIYSEGFFDIRWNADSIPETTLVATDDAISIPSCGTPETVVCEGPSIETVGRMPARSPHLDTTTGYAERINRPKSGGTRPDGTAPFAGTLQLHGCHRFEEASYYRVMYAFENESERPFTGHEWYHPAIQRNSVHVGPPDTDGWYPILDVPYLENYYGESFSDNPLISKHWFFNWNTRSYRNGTYTVRLELGDENKDPLADDSPRVEFEVDNRGPHLQIEELVWGKRSEPVANWDNELTERCPRIQRPTGTDIGIKVTFRAWGEHFRSVNLKAKGCEDDPERIQPSASGQTNSYAYWHNSVNDRSHRKTVAFEVPANYPAGAYRLALRGVSRAFNPAGSGTGPGTNWTGDQNYVDSHAGRLLSIENK